MELQILIPLLVLLLIAGAVIAYRRWRSRRFLMRRVQELEALSSAGRAILEAELDLMALCELIAREAGRIINTDTFQIGLFTGDRYTIYFWMVEGVRRQTPEAFELGEDGGLVGWIRQHRAPMVVRDFEREMDRLPARPGYSSEHPPRSAVFVPLIRGSEAIGLLAAQSATPNAFSGRDVERLGILANQAAAAIANAQILDVARRRAAQLELVGEIARQVNTINDLEELFGQVVLLTKETFGYDEVTIFGIDPVSGEARPEASNLPAMAAAGVRIPPGVGMIGTAAATRSTTLSNNTLEDTRFVISPISAETRSEIAIPLIVNDRLLGILDVQSNELGAFGVQEQTVLEALAAQVAVAIHKAQQFALQREQAWITTAQLQVAEAISRSNGLDEMLESVVRLTPLLVGAECSALLLWDDDWQQYTGAAAHGVSDAAEARLMAQPLALGDWKALDAVHVGQEKLETRQQPPWRLGETDNADMEHTLLPLAAGGQMLGVMVVGGTTAEASGQDEILRNIASQTCQALHNIRLQQGQQEEAWVNTALLQVAEAVNKLTNLNEILTTIVRMIPILVGVDSCIVLVWDEEQQSFRAGPSHGLSEMEVGLLESFEVDLSEFPQIERLDIERVGPDATVYRTRVPRWMETILGAESADIVPLYARATLVGALVVGPSRNGLPLRGRRLNIVTGIAQQAAIAVVNDQLYREAAERSRIEQELDVARTIQASLMPQENPTIEGCSIASYWQAARQVSGDFYDFLPLSGDRWALLVADVADKGVPAALFMAVSRTILRTVGFNRQHPGEVLQRANEIIYQDTSSDLFVTVFYTVYDPHQKVLHYASGGHNPALHVRRDGAITLLQSEGIALGVLHKVRIEQKQVKVAPGDMLVFYTDGVTEAINEDFDEFGMDRLCAVVRQVRRGTAADAVQAITSAVSDHAGGAARFDDMTLVVLKHE